MHEPPRIGCEEDRQVSMAIKQITRVLMCWLVVSIAVPQVIAQQAPENKQDAMHRVAATDDPSRPKLPAELPSVPPKVSCNGDQLTIVAENATMGSILDAIRACIGVQIDIPDGYASARTYASLGPGPATKVIESLLSSTDMNFVIQSQDAHPQKVQAVVLMGRARDPRNAKESSEATVLTMTPARKAWLNRRRNARPGTIADDDSSSVEVNAGVPI